MIDHVTVRDLDDLIAKISFLEKDKEMFDQKIKEINKELMKHEATATRYLKELNRNEYDTPIGKLKISEKWHVNLPDTDLAKLEFFEWLKSQGIFEKYATINSRSLQSLYKAEMENAKERGEDPLTFSLPGIPAPKLYEQTDFKSKKGK